MHLLMIDVSIKRWGDLSNKKIVFWNNFYSWRLYSEVFSFPNIRFWFTMTSIQQDIYIYISECILLYISDIYIYIRIYISYILSECISDLLERILFIYIQRTEKNTLFRNVLLCSSFKHMNNVTNRVF